MKPTKQNLETRYRIISNAMKNVIVNEARLFELVDTHVGAFVANMYFKVFKGKKKDGYITIETLISGSVAEESEMRYSTKVHIETSVGASNYRINWDDFGDIINAIGSYFDDAYPGNAVESQLRLLLMEAV